MAILLQYPIRCIARAECCHLQRIGEMRWFWSGRKTGASESSEVGPSGAAREPSKSQMKPEHQEDDYVGPVCPRSNLRQVRYSNRFSSRSFVDKGAADQNLQHPYSLQEFNLDPIESPRPLAELRARLELEELEWHFFRNRVDKLNQNFWESQSTRFEEYEAAVKDKVLQSTDDLPSTNRKDFLQEQLDTSLDEFYRSWLIEEKQVFMKYNWDWWRLQPALMKGGWKAQMRILKWNLACWRYSLSFKNSAKQSL